MPTLRSRASLNSRFLSICCARVCLFGFGGVIAVVGILLFFTWPFITSRLTESQLVLSSGSRSYGMWAETPIPMYFNVYMWNWTNPETSLRGPHKPAFTQMGPYVFLEHHSKKNVTWNDNNTISYLNQKQWHFVPEKSNGSLDDIVTNLNPIAMTIGWFCLDLSVFIRKMAINPILNWEEGKVGLVKRDTVGNLLFYGSDDPFLDLVSTLKKYIEKFPDMPDKFGWFYKRNMSETRDGVFTMGSGQGDINSLGMLSAWNYQNRTPFTGECGHIHGTYGEEFPPGSVDQDKITLFANDLCSVLNLKRQESASMFGIPSVLFAGDKDVFSNETTCYCQAPNQCPASGVRELARCNKSPSLVSWPHFYLADQSYRDAVDGMSPDKEKHQFYMNLAEVTSIPLEVRGRMQLNFRMQSIEGLSMFNNVPQTVVPMLWFDQAATLTPEMAGQVRVLVDLVWWGGRALLASACAGGLLVAIGALLVWRGKLDNDDVLLS